mgnify:CR=1 FL=1
MVKGKSEAIKAARLERGWSLSELAKQVDVTKETVARIERGRNRKEGSRCTRPTRRRAVHHIVREAAA